MAATTQEFVANFHSLTGIDPGERRKNLFLLLKRTHQRIELGSGDVDITFIQPKTPLEESFRVEVLIYFKRVPDLIDVLKSENPVLIEKVLKVSSWFLGELLNTFNEKELVEQLFPYLSFNTKVKLLNKLALHLKNTQQADAIFDAVSCRYGLYLAWKLLPCCSDNLIMKYVKSLKLEITPRQLLLIVNKRPHLTQSILKALEQFHKNYNFSSKYKYVFVHLMKNDVMLFLKLCKEYNPCCRLGRRATNAILFSNKQSVIENAEEFSKILHKKQTVKGFGNEFIKFYINMFPLSPSQFQENINFYLEFMNGLPSSASKLNTLLTAFKKRYGNELWASSACITPAILELMTPDEREDWMQTNQKPNDLLEEVWICLKKTEVSIPALKSRILLASNVKEKAELVGCLLETCRINGDRVALTGVCKHVLKHHRNENSVLMCLLRTLKNCFNLDTLDEEQWKCIKDITELFIARQQIPYYYNDWLFAYIHYCLANQSPIKELLLETAKKVHMTDGGYANMKEPKYQKQILLTFGDIITSVHKEDALESQYIAFLCSVMQYNLKNPKDEIPLHSFANAMNALKNSLVKEDGYNYMAGQLVVYCLKLHYISEEERIYWLEAACKSKMLTNDVSCVNWLLKHKPNLLVKYIDSVVNGILGLWYTMIPLFFWKNCKNYSHLEIPQKIIAVCLNVINKEDDQSESQKRNAITALSFLMKSQEFLRYIVQYYPSDMKIDPNNEENQETYKIQQAITASLKNVIPPSIIIESMLRFSKGDYLKFIQRSLHSASLSIPENKLMPLFTSLADCAVSVRKHVIYHTFKVLDKVEIFRMLTKSMETEKNSSIRKFLLKAIFNYFAKNPDEYVWNLVKENVRAVDINDEEAFEILTEISKVPLTYLSQYIVFTWEILEALPSPADSVKGKKCLLLEAASSDVIPSLSNEFCYSIVEKCLFKTTEVTDFQINIMNFACKYILYSVTELEQRKRLDKIFVLLKNYISSTWPHVATRRIERDFVNRFLKEFCSFFLTKLRPSHDILAKFVELWNNTLQPQEAFDEYLYLQFTLLYVDHTTNNLTLLKVGERLAELGDSVFSIYGSAAMDLFSNTLNSFMASFVGADVEWDMKPFVLIENINKASNSTHSLLIMISLLPTHIADVPKIKIKFNEIITTLKQSSEPAVQLLLTSYLHNICDSCNNDILRKDEYIENEYKHKKPRGFFNYMEEFTSKYRQ